MKEHQIFFGIEGEGPKLKAVISDIRCTRSVGISIDSDNDYKFVINVKQCKLNPVAYFADSKEMSAHLNFYFDFLFGGANNCDFWAYSEQHAQQWNAMLTESLQFNYVSHLAKGLGVSAENVESAIKAMTNLAQTEKGFGSVKDIPDFSKHSELTLAVSASICILRFAKKASIGTFKAAMGAKK